MDWWIMYGTEAQIEQGALQRRAFDTKADVFEFAQQVIIDGWRVFEITGPTGETFKEATVNEAVRGPVNPGS